MRCWSLGFRVSGAGRGRSLHNGQDLCHVHQGHNLARALLFEMKSAQVQKSAKRGAFVRAGPNCCWSGARQFVCHAGLPIVSGCLM